MADIPLLLGMAVKGTMDLRVSSQAWLGSCSAHFDRSVLSVYAHNAVPSFGGWETDRKNIFYKYNLS